MQSIRQSVLISQSRSFKYMVSMRPNQRRQGPSFKNATNSHNGPARPVTGRSLFISMQRGYTAAARLG